MRARLSATLLAVLMIGPWASDAPGASFSWKNYADKADEWFRGPDGKRTTENLLSN
jgi:hypothetical protein